MEENKIMKKGFEKRFNKGDIVYWCDGNINGYHVKWGMVDEQFSDAVCIDFLERKECRYIDDIPLDEFRKNEYNQKYRKLPKGWTYSSELFKVEDRMEPDEKKMFKELCTRIDNPESLKKAYDLGLLVKAETKFHGEIEAKITKEGYKVVTKYPMWKEFITRTSVRPDKVYFTYQEAKDEVDANMAELHRQAEMSDYDWAVEQIDKTLRFWKSHLGITEEERKAYMDWLLAMDNVEDIEVRVFGSNIQWKYEKNKKWNNITL